ncbi:MAG: hypothetical protein HKN68_17370, partial [Saprospiraceae bacterium]|nr:hypothetical protein [Saprospiraceae bacterium]
MESIQLKTNRKGVCASKLLVLFFSLFFAGNLSSQCDATIGGVYYFCDPDEMDFFVGFTVNGGSGTFNVVDLNGNVTNNSGYYTIPRIAIPMTGIPLSPSTSEYIQFGPFSNDDVFDIVLQNGGCTIPVLSGSYTCVGKSNTNAMCGATVPYYEIVFNSSNAQEVDILENNRGGNMGGDCCGDGRAVEFKIEIGTGIAGITLTGEGAGGFGNATILSGSVMDMNYCMNADSSELNDPICLEPGINTVIFIKDGNDDNSYTITPVPSFNVISIALTESCDMYAIDVGGTSEITWTAIDNGRGDGIIDPGLDNLDCGSGPGVNIICNSLTFSYNTSVHGVIDQMFCGGKTYKYQVATVDSCAGAVMDTLEITVYPDYGINLSFECDDPQSVTINSEITGNGSTCMNYLYNWVGEGVMTPSLSGAMPGQTYTLEVTLPGLDTICVVSQSITIPDVLFDITSCPPGGNALCLSQIPAATPGSVVYVNVCGTSEMIFVSETQDMGSGCVGDPLTFTRTYTLDIDGDPMTTNDQVSCDQVFIVVDDVAPIVTAPGDEAFEGCEAGDVETVSNFAYSTISVDITNEDYTTEGLMITEVCGIQSVEYIDEMMEVGCVVTVNRTYTVIDLCNNSNSDIQVFTITDMTPPTLTGGMNGSGECTGSDPSMNAGYIAWRDSHAGAMTTDIC